MRNEHSCCGWNNSNRYDVFDMQKKTKRRKNEIQFFCILSLSLPFTYTWHSGHAINIHWLLDLLIRTFHFSLSIYTHLCFACLLVLVDFNSNTKSTPFSHQLFSPNSFLNYSSTSNRRTSSPIEHQHHPSNEENEEITTDDNDDYLDEDSCNR